MTAAENKAKELVDKFLPLVASRKQNGNVISIGVTVRHEYAKQCAIICCEEVISELEDSKQIVDDNDVPEFNKNILYWGEAINHINKM